jgi:hypothetical protein
VLCRVFEALGKVFVECCTQQRGLGEHYIGKGFFAEYFFSGTWQSQIILGKEKRSSRRRDDGDDVFVECYR